ncbi:MAG: class I SAM-dependent methyltransferase [Octadecabacter sp.]|nr:class I SAM-dependent methyltransferase [Octadecabacter sp.]
MTNSTAFWNKMAPRYARAKIRDTAAYEYTLGRTLSYLTSTSRVLEIACGTASTAVLIAPHVGQITATDAATAMIDIARSKCADLPNLDLRGATAAEAVAHDDPFDAVLAFSILHLLDDRADVLAQIFARLPSGGLLISKTPCLSDPTLGYKRYLIRALVPVLRLFGLAPDVGFFTGAQMERAIKDAGFLIEESGNFPAMSRYVVARKP